MSKQAAKIERVSVIAPVDQPGQMDQGRKYFLAKDGWSLVPHVDDTLGVGVLIRKRAAESQQADPRVAFVPITNIKSIDFTEA